MRNESEFIKCSKNRYLTAKSSKFKSMCVDIAVKKLGFTRYHAEMKPLKDQLSSIITHLLIDKTKRTISILKVHKERN